MVKIETVTVGSGGAASVTFSNIPQTYTDLVVLCSVRNESTSGQMTMVFNSSTDATYSRRKLYGDGSTVVSNSGSSETVFNYIDIPYSTYTANTFSNASFYIPNYTSSSNKSFLVDSVEENNSTTSYAEIIAGLRSSTAAITSITFAINNGVDFNQHSSFTLYGISKTTAQIKATGGMVYDDASYVYHLFTSSGTFTPLQNIVVDCLVVGGGGSGGWGSGGGGGGAGGLRQIDSTSISSNISYTVTVGAGGTPVGNTVDSRGNSGSNSSISGSGFSTITATGGGGGGSEAGTSTNRDGASGGSGGGGCYRNSSPAGSGGSGNAGSFSPVEGYSGGSGAVAGGVNYGGGGGGGSASSGISAPGSGNGGGGGNGTNWKSLGSFYAGGGGGGSQLGGAGATPGVGGSSIGGTGGNYLGVAATAGVINTGSGGGGGAFGGSNPADARGGAGSSGVVIVRYAK